MIFVKCLCSQRKAAIQPSLEKLKVSPRICRNMHDGCNVIGVGVLRSRICLPAEAGTKRIFYTVNPPKIPVVALSINVIEIITTYKSLLFKALHKFNLWGNS